MGRGDTVLLFVVHPVSHPDPLGIATRAQHAVAVIPARFDSTRFPGKPLADIDGRTMIEHVYRRASAATRISAVLVATDDRRIADAVTAFGGEARMTASNHRSGLDRVAEVAHELDCALVVNVQGDEPLIEPSDIDRVLQPFDDDETLLMSTLRTPLRHPADLANPDVVKIVVNRRGDALYFSRAQIPYPRSCATSATLEGDRPPATTYKHLGLYAYRRTFAIQAAGLAPTPLELAESLEQLRVLEHGFRIHSVETEHDSIGVDSPADLERVRRVLTAATSTMRTHDAAL